MGGMRARQGHRGPKARRLMAWAIAVAMTAVLLPAVPPASADAVGSCWEHAAGTVHDANGQPADDEAASHADLVEYCIDFTDERVRLAARVAAPVDPRTDAGWAAGAQLHWDVAATGTQREGELVDEPTEALYRAVYSAQSGEALQATLHQPAGNEVCDGTPGYENGWLVVEFPVGDGSDCFAGETQLAVSPLMAYPADNPEDPARFDRAPSEPGYKGFVTGDAGDPPPSDDGLPTRLQDLWVVERLRTVDDAGDVVDLTDAVLDGLTGQGGQPVELADGATFTPKPALDAHIADAGGQPRDDVAAVGGVLDTPGGPALAVVGTPDDGAHIRVDDRMRFDLTFLGEELLAPGDPLFADHLFIQALPVDGGDNTLAPLDLLSERMAAQTLRYLAVDDGNGGVDAGVLVDQVWETFAGSTGVGAPAKADPMLDGFQDGVKGAADEGFGLDGVKEYWDNFGDGAEESNDLISDQICTDDCGPEPDPDPEPTPTPTPDPPTPDCYGPCGGSTSDPHLETFDRMGYNLQAVGEFVAARTDGLEVQLRFAPWRGSRLVSTTTGAAIETGGHRVTVTAGEDNPVRVDGAVVAVDELAFSPRDLGGAEVEVRHDTLQVRTADGHQVSVAGVDDEWFNVYVTDGQGVAWRGLFGDADGDPANDLTARDGRNLGPNPSFDELYDDFAESWRVSDATSLFDYDAGASTATHTDRSFPDGPVTSDGLPTDDRARAETVCRTAGIVDEQVLDDCIIDYAMTGEMSFVAGNRRADTVQGFSDGRISLDGSTQAPTTPEPDEEAACPAGDVPPHGFADVADASVHADGIACVAWYGLTQGITATQYGPAARVNRAQMASFVARLVAAGGGELPAATDQGFADVDPSGVHADAINRLAAAGIVQGTSATSYAPGAQVRRDQMATFLVNAYDHVADSDLPEGSSGFGDIDGNVHEAAIDKAAEAGFALGTSSTTYSPASPVRRDQMASFLTRVLERFAVDGNSLQRVELATPEVPEPREVVEHGGQYWGVLWVGEFGDPALDQVRQAIDQRWGPVWMDGDIGCNDGAADALDAAPDARAVAVHFDTEADAAQFAEHADLPSDPTGYAQVTTFCLD